MKKEERKIMKKLLSKNDGYALIWVLTILFVVASLSTAFVSLLYLTAKSTTIHHNSQQAYYTAKSAVASVVSYIQENEDDTTVLDNILNTTGSGSSVTMGDYVVNVTSVSANRIKILATATYDGQTESVAAYIVKLAPASYIIPTDNVIYVNGSATTGFGQCSVNGSVFVDGDFVLSQGSSINGSVVVTGNTTIDGAGNTTKGLVSFGNVKLDNGGKVDGDVYTNGGVILYGASVVSGNLYTDKSLDMTSGSSVIVGDAVVGQNVGFAGGSNRIHGALAYAGSISVAYGTVTTFVPSGATHLDSYTNLDLTSYNAPILPTIPVPTVSENPQLYNPVTITSNTISSSGTITDSVVNQMKALPWGTTLIIDATSSNISLRMNNTTWSTTNGLKIKIRGTNKVYLFMEGTSSFVVNANQYVGNEIAGTTPNLYIIGNGAQSVSLFNNSELDAMVYIPNGNIITSGSPLTTYKFIGCCIVKSATISSNVAFQYSAPDVSGTPLEILNGGGSGSSGSGWTIESWADN